MLEYIFKSVFVHRYRYVQFFFWNQSNISCHLNRATAFSDILPDIRSICINELGQWMQVYPEHFLEDAYLKYIGWTLYDKVWVILFTFLNRYFFEDFFFLNFEKCSTQSLLLWYWTEYLVFQVSDVRLKCIMALLPLYERLDMVYKLELFTNKFKDRLVSMVMDKDNEVAMRACQLLTAIYRYFNMKFFLHLSAEFWALEKVFHFWFSFSVFPSVLELKDCVPIYELVYCNHHGLAQAAGEFLNTKVVQFLCLCMLSCKCNVLCILDLLFSLIIMRIRLRQR